MASRTQRSKIKNIYVRGECAREQLFSLSLLLLPDVTAMLKVPQSCLQVLNIILQLVNSPRKDQQGEDIPGIKIPFFSGVFYMNNGAL